MNIRAIDRKLLRDLRGMWGQAVAIAFVLLAGVATYVGMISVMETLQTTLDEYYRDYRFADGFANVRRAPETLRERLRRVPGVSHVETRVTAAANLEVPGFDDPISSLIVSLPGSGQPALNRLFLRQGRLPGETEGEVVLNEPFAEAQDLAVGDRFTAILNGRRRTLSVVGIALSPEFLMQIQPGSLFPDPERFGVLWMNRSALAAANDMEGAFNDVAFTLAPGANIDQVTARMDVILERYGGRGAFPRADQPSHILITEELQALGAVARMLPVIFLAVAAFLLNIVVTRLISLQREQIAALKAFGYSNRAIGIHYIKLVLVIATAGSVAGILLGIWAGSAMGQMYMEYYRFPYLEYTLRPAVVLTAVTLTTAAAVLGVLRAVGRAVRLAPAEAMRPAPPARYRRTVVERLGLQRLFDQPTRMIMRHLERQPLKAGLAILGISASCAILIMGVFFTDAIDYMIQVQYGIAQRDDLTVTFIEPTSTAAIHEIASLPGVLHVEPFRSVPVRLRNGHREYETAIEGIPPDAYLRRVIDEDLQPITIPAEGMVLATRLAAILGAEAGDSLVVEVLEGSRRTHRVPVVALSEQLIGLGAYMDMTAVNRLAGVGQAVSGAFLMIDHRHEADITDALQDRPRVAAMIAQERAIQSFLDTSASSLLVFTFVLSLFAGVIAFGVIYNSARISLSERSRELASMRVLGFTRGEISYILLGELALLVLLSIPLGFGLGAIGSHAVGASVDNEMYKVPVVLDRGTFGTAALVVLSAAIASALLMRRRLHRLDLIAVLKTRE